MIQTKTTPTEQTNLLSTEPLTLYQLSLVADEILTDISAYRPEFANLARLQRAAGCRVQELFQPDRWTFVSSTVVQLQPQKRNALRILQLSEIGHTDQEGFTPTLADMRRLPPRQYERAFTYIVASNGLWRLYEDGFAHPSTHLFRHVKIQELAAQGMSKEYIATWIGEKSPDNLDYYLNSKYYM